MTAPKNRLRELRERSRLTLDEAGIIVGLHPTTISRHENGSRNLGDDDIKKYAKLYKVSTYEIFFSSEELESVAAASNEAAEHAEQ